MYTQLLCPNQLGLENTLTASLYSMSVLDMALKNLMVGLLSC